MQAGAQEALGMSFARKLAGFAPARSDASEAGTHRLALNLEETRSERAPWSRRKQIWQR
jgi:hypothetical protein